MSLRTQQILTALVGPAVAALNATLGWHLNPNVVAAIVLGFAGVAYSIGQIEATHGTLAQDWAKIEPRLVDLLDALDGAAHSQAATPTAPAQAPTTPPQG